MPTQSLIARRRFRWTTVAAIGLCTTALAALLASSNAEATASLRPVSDAVLRLEQERHWAVTYEDPEYSSSVPKGGELKLDPQLFAGTRPDEPYAVIQAIVDAEAQRVGFAEFRVTSSSGIFHVIPVESNPLLDTVVSLPEKERTADGFLRLLCEEVSNTTGKSVSLGIIPLNLVLQRSVRVSGRGPARQLLSSFSREIGDQEYAALSWQLFYTPREKQYVLNLHVISKSEK